MVCIIFGTSIADGLDVGNSPVPECALISIQSRNYESRARWELDDALIKRVCG
jgi:hypothetical protein